MQPQPTKPILISINDKDQSFICCDNLDLFKFVHYCTFDDTEDESHPGVITLDTAKGICDILQYARDTATNVVVHCNAGLCRSGAVVSFGIKYLGFKDTGVPRMGNKLVQQRLCEASGVDDPEVLYLDLFGG